MKSWDGKGCKLCRALWEEGKLPTQLGISIDRHATLYYCAECGSYWEEHERFSDVITREDVKKYYPGVLNE